MPSTESRQGRVRADLERRLDDLPVLPEVAAQVVALDPAAENFANRIETLARLDPPLTARLLRLCGLRRGTPSTIAEAIVQVGARALAETMTSLTVMQVFVPTTAGQRNLWVHAIGTALTARHIAEIARPGWSIAPERAYLAGLMHDIGRFVMYDLNPAELGRVDETRWISPAELVAAEMQICGFDHAFLGALACERWGFPDLVTSIVRTHHSYRREGRSAGDLGRLVRVLQAADMVNILMLTRPNCVDAAQAERAKMIEGLFRSVQWSDTDAPFQAADLAADLGRIRADWQRLVTVLGLAVPTHLSDGPRA
jgi:HD-like signal output (HDOD) protein